MSEAAAQEGVMSDTIHPGETDVVLLVDVQNDFCPDGPQINGFPRKP